MPEPTLRFRLSPSSTRSRVHRRGPPPAIVIAAALTGILLSGCNRPGPAPPPNTRVFVRMSSLVSLHPSWADVHEIDILLAHAAGLASSHQGAVQAGNLLPEVPLPPPLTADPVPFSSRPPSLEGVTRAAAIRLSKLREAMDARAERIIQRERRELTEKAAADIAAKKADLTAAAITSPLYLGLSTADRQELRRLQFQEIAFESQVAVLFPPARGAALVNLQKVREQIRSIEAKAPKTEEQLQARIDKQLSDFRQARAAETERELNQRRFTLQAETRQRLDPYEKRLQERMKLPGPLALTGSSTAAVSAPQIISPKSLAAAAPGMATGQPATGAAVNSLRAQRARLVAYITDDIRRRVEALARRRHWTLSTNASEASDASDARAGYTDITSQAASALKNEIKNSSQGAGN